MDATTALPAWPRAIKGCWGHPPQLSQSQNQSWTLGSGSSVQWPGLPRLSQLCPGARRGWMGLEHLQPSRLAL